MPVRAGEPLNPELTRERILATAEDLFYRRGIAMVGVAEIAEAAEASKMSIYKNFGSKTGLVEAVLRDRSDRVRRWLADGVAAHPPGVRRVLALFDLLAVWFAENRFRGCALVNAMAESRGEDAMVTRLTRRHLRGYRDLLERHLTEAGAADPARLARQLLVLIEGATVVSSVERDPTAATDARQAAETLLTAAIPISPAADAERPETD